MQDMRLLRRYLWDMAPCSSYVNRRFGGKYHLILSVANHPRKKEACGTCLGRYSVSRDTRCIRWRGLRLILVGSLLFLDCLPGQHVYSSDGRHSWQSSCTNSILRFIITFTRGRHWQLGPISILVSRLCSVFQRGFYLSSFPTKILFEILTHCMFHISSPVYYMLQRLWTKLFEDIGLKFRNRQMQLKCDLESYTFRNSTLASKAGDGRIWAYSNIVQKESNVHISVNGILHSHRRENLKSYVHYLS
jgi:hypothetical protein